MKIAIAGCTHGELDKIYSTISELELKNSLKVDILLCCGDFQSVRNLSDMKSMSCPDKYKQFGSFHEYFSGSKLPPVLTVFVGGNHEASIYLQELPFGGWVAPRIYYLGYSGVIDINGLRIGGLSGIYKPNDFNRGRFESSPYTPDTIKSVYHYRNVDVFRLKQMSDEPPDIILSHDWPNGIAEYGDLNTLLRQKRFLKDDIQNGRLGSPQLMDLLKCLKPQFWFAAHLHVKFPALVSHSDKKCTKFMALDKCLPGHKFLQVLDIGPKINGPLILSRDPRWLCVLKSTNHLDSISNFTVYMPGPSSPSDVRWDFKPTDQEMEKIKEIFSNNFVSQDSEFDKTCEPLDLEKDKISHLSQTKMMPSGVNSQTTFLCDKLNIIDPLRRLPKTVENFSEEIADESNFSSFNQDEIELDEEDDDEVEDSKPKLVLPPPKLNEDPVTIKSDDPFIIDPIPDNSVKISQVAGIKRRNQSIYNNDDSN